MASLIYESCKGRDALVHVGAVRLSFVMRGFAVNELEHELPLDNKKGPVCTMLRDYLMGLKNWSLVLQCASFNTLGRHRLHGWICRWPTSLVGTVFVGALFVAGIVPKAAAQQPSGSSAKVSAEAPAEEPGFDINEYRVLGNTLLDARAVESAVYPFLGPRKSLKVVQQARDALAAVYRNAGYGTVVVEIPEQSVDEGVVRLRVTEGRLQRTVISGARYYSERHILHELPALKPGEVPKLPELQAQLSQLATEAKDRQVTPILKAGTDPGTVAVDLKVQDELPLHASLQIDDRHTADTEPVRVTGIVSYENMFQRAETLSVQYETAPQATSEVQLLAMTYMGRTSNPKLTWDAYAIHSDSDVAAVGTLSVLGHGNIFGGRLNLALKATPQWLDSLSFGLDYKDFQQAVNLTTGGSTTPIHYLIWSGQYSLNTHQPGYDFATSLAVNFGIRNLGDRDSDFEYDRAGALADFVYLRGSDLFTYRFWHDSSVRLRLGYQYTDTPLVTNEQFAIGGVDTVRGYLESESLNDTGVNESFEISPPLLKVGTVNNLFYAFYDAAQGGIQQPLPSQTSHVELVGTGLGLHSTWLDRWDSTFDWAVALRNGPRTGRGNQRLHFTVKYQY